MREFIKELEDWIDRIEMQEYDLNHQIFVVQDMKNMLSKLKNLDEATKEAESPKTCCAQSKTASKHKYWINYGTITVEDKKPNFFHGNHEIIRDTPITCKEDFESICEQIKNEMASGQGENILSVFVTSWTKFE